MSGFLSNHPRSFVAVCVVIAVIAVGVFIDTVFPPWGSDFYEKSIIYRLWIMAILMLFIPISAIGYVMLRRGVREQELKEDCRLLNLSFKHYEKTYRRQTNGMHFVFAVAFCLAVTVPGLTAVMLGTELKLHENENLFLLGAFDPTAQTSIEEYQKGALMFFGLAFAGAYIWGLLHILHRYYISDLVPAVYLGLGTRMLVSAFIAVVLYHTLPMAGVENGSQEGVVGALLPAVAFMIGIFPQRALQYLADKVNAVVRLGEVNAKEISVEILQGVSMNNRMRLAEEGIESCYDLAKADFIQLLFRTPFQPRQLIDWQLQAWLVAYFGEAVTELQKIGVRTVTDLKEIGEKGSVPAKDKVAAAIKEEGVTETTIDLALQKAEGDLHVNDLLALNELLLVKHGAPDDDEPPKQETELRHGPDTAESRKDAARDGRVLVERSTQGEEGKGHRVTEQLPEQPPKADAPNGGPSEDAGTKH